VILYDEKNGNPDVLDFLLPYNIKPNVQTWRCFDWNNNFADWKNILNDYCSGDYIFQIDADEMISEYMVGNLYEILELNPDVDLIFVPRINTVEGITQEHINKWGWNVNDKGYVNYPDYQGRIYRKNMSWYGKVHERIIGGQKFSSLPNDNELYCIQHHKTITKQEKQNDLYNKI
jgi:glycosyltransferase involved in cell wall biosynthesis